MSISIFIRHRDSGGGGPPCEAGWWRGRRTQRAARLFVVSKHFRSLASSCSENFQQRQRSSASSAPSTTVRSLRELQWSPSPAIAGADGASALIPATHLRPSFVDESHEAFASKKIKGGGAPKRRNCPVGPRHASDVATQMRVGRGRASSGTRSPFGAPPRRLPRPCAEARSRPRFTRCSAPALPSPGHRA